MRRVLLHIVAAGAMLAPCATTWGQAAATASRERPRIAYVGHSPDGEPWWDPVKNGLVQAGEDFGIDFEFLNPADGSIEAMARMVAGLSGDRYDGVVSTIADYEKLQQALTTVVKARKLPLITANSGTHDQSENVGALLHVGQPEEPAGRLAGEHARKAGVKSFICVNRYIANTATRQRCDGFARGLGLSVPGPQLEVGSSEAEMEAQVLRYIEAHPHLDALLTMGPTEAHPTMAALRRLKPGVRKPYFVTFDLSRQITAGIASGTVDFAIDQQPYLQGYLPAALLARRIRHPEDSLLMTKISVFAEAKLHARVTKYGLTLKPGEGRHLNSGPGFVSRANVGKVEQYGGQYR